MHVGWNRNAKNTRKRDVFDEFLMSERPAKAPKAVWTRTLAREAPKNEIWMPKSTRRVRVQIQKSRENVWFLQCFTKSE